MTGLYGAQLGVFATQRRQNKYFCRSTTTILAGSDGCSLDHARGWPDGWPRWRSGRSLGVAAGSEEAEDQTE